MNPVLSAMLREKTVVDRFGQTHAVAFGIERAEGEFLQSLVAGDGINCTIEVGCAMGISSLYICDALAAKETRRHVVIDPFQSTDWSYVGVDNIRKAGFDFVELVEQPSELALPELLKRREVFDLALIDGMHTFDHVILDFFYVSRMIRVGGIIVLDDVNMNAINKVVRYVSNCPAFRILGWAGARNASGRRRVSNCFKRFLSPCVRALGERLAHEFFDDSVVRPDVKLGLESSMIAFQKAEEDRRPWNWYRLF